VAAARVRAAEKERVAERARVARARAGKEKERAVEKERADVVKEGSFLAPRVGKRWWPHDQSNQAISLRLPQVYIPAVVTLHLGLTLRLAMQVDIG
jgi:hypothetical protein